jgi:hydroxymethylbilane synthase
MQHIRIGTRGSELALWQAEHVKKQLQALGATVEITIIKTQGDEIQHLSFDKLEGKGFFTKEIEQALLDKSVDLAVHSHKDLETNTPPGLRIAAVSQRENPADVLLIHPKAFEKGNFWNLKDNAVIGTSSQRRKAQVVAFRPDAQLKDLRGNVPTRLNKLVSGEYDAILLAKAGLDRLNIDLQGMHEFVMDPTEFVPAPAQGVLALQVREEEKELIQFLSPLNDMTVASKIELERAILNQLEGGCQLPLGAYCPKEGKIFVAYAKQWEEGTEWFEFEGPHDHGLVEVILETLQNPESWDEQEDLS